MNTGIATMNIPGKIIRECHRFNQKLDESNVIPITIIIVRVVKAINKLLLLSSIFSFEKRSLKKSFITSPILSYLVSLITFQHNQLVCYNFHQLNYLDNIKVYHYVQNLFFSHYFYLTLQFFLHQTP